MPRKVQDNAVNMNFQVPKLLHSRLRGIAALRHVTMSELITDLLESVAKETLDVELRVCFKRK